MAADAFLREAAPAKVNLTLHVVGRCDDGYHLLESVVVFAEISDEITLEPAQRLALHTSGPTAGATGEPSDNLVLKAARALAARRPGLATGRFRLTKRLPVAAGIGGGSSDAAAALRLLARLNSMSRSDPDILSAAREVGADVTVCLDPRPQFMAGTGEVLSPLPAFASLPAVLVNPGVAMPTASVFSALGLPLGARIEAARHPALAGGVDPPGWIERLAGARNDLEGVAMTLSPAVGEALDLMRRQEGCRLARMSGSGATIFGLFPSCAAAARGAKAIRAAHPRWWVKATRLG
jgi:4-diphosphocytidyl-2-C-methyl-D-erythritol kinase